MLNGEGIVSVVAAQLLEMDEEELSEDTKKAILTELLKRPQQKNISYFAFTATPKFKTLAVFKESGVYGKPPFHYYGMKQVIEEGFIMDVLEHYSTYEIYFNLLKSIEDDPQVTQKKAGAVFSPLQESATTQYQSKGRGYCGAFYFIYKAFAGR